MKSTFLFCGVSVMLAGCASTPLALSPVGPGPNNRPALAQKSSEGHLQVFSAREKSNEIGFNTYFYPHSGYRINDADGKTVSYVPNHLSDMDEYPDQVTLPAGNYQVVARSTWSGQVIVPVVIENGNTTVVHLDDSAWTPSGAAADQLVYLPNKEAVGWGSSQP